MTNTAAAVANSKLSQYVPGETSYGSRRLRLLEYQNNRQVCQPYAPVAFTPKRYPWYTFLVEVKSTPGPHSDRKG